MIELILDNRGMRVCTVKDGKYFVRPVDSATFKKVLTKGARFDTGMLPANTRCFRQRGRHTVLAVELPRTKRRIRTGYEDAESVFVGCAMPAGVFFFKLFHNDDKTYNITRAEIFATKSDGITSLKTALLHYPVPNNSGGICWGDDDESINAPLRAFSAVEGVISSYFSTRFNAELGLPHLSRQFPIRLNSYNGDEGVREYFRELAKHDQFDDKWLPKETRRTFESTLNRFIDAQANTEVGNELEDNGDLDEDEMNEEWD